ncbi:MAG: diaminopimelate decarboxylase [Candidatus Omnitrophota bacterium]|nr:diaminopimelate decarboxylase [Candidatus Omnitrophota bacterium]
MHDFKYKGNSLYCESIRVEDLSKKVATPFYLYSYKTLIDHFRKLKKAFRSINPLICYSMKANSNLAICSSLVKEGAGLDIVSGGELFKATKSGVSPKKIVYASVGKTQKEIQQALKIGILFFNVESEAELENINRVARNLKKDAKVAIRINPDVEPKTHQYITTGRLTNKFGIDFRTAKNIFLKRKEFRNLKINGLHIHIGSQIIKSAPFVSAIKRVANFVAELKKELIDLEFLNIGGGLGIIYKDEKPQTADEFAKAVLPILKQTGLKIILEPGRFIAGNAGILVAKVLYIKKTKAKTFVIVDAGMNDLIRPALYSAYHEILPIEHRAFPRLRSGQASIEHRKKVDIVGPICESADFFAKDRLLPRINEGDLLAIMGAGAYGFSMSSNYNCRSRVAEVMVIKNKFFITRKRETYNDLIRGETIPSILK